MGYHIRTGLVEEHAGILKAIKTSIERGESLRYDCAQPEELNSRKYEFNRILKATSVLTHECNGSFVGLRGKVRIRTDWKNLALIIEPTTPTGTLNTLIPIKNNEQDVLERLKQFEGKMDLIRFTPSLGFDLETWRSNLLDIGFDLMPDPETLTEWIGGPRDNGDFEYAVSRIEEKTPSGFDLLSAFED